MTEESAGELASLLKAGHLEKLNVYSNDAGDGGAFKVRTSLAYELVLLIC